MKITVAGQELTFALEGKNTLTVSNGNGGSWNVRLCTSIPTRGFVYLGPKRRPPPDGDPYLYPAARLAASIRQHFAKNESILGDDLRAFLDRFSPLKLSQAA